jgi:hypothetical protein
MSLPLTPTFFSRRETLAALAATFASGNALAHHGWSSFDDTQPIYLEGKASKVRWGNPHVELMLTLNSPLALPADLAKRNIPAQAAQVNAADLLAKARLPKRKDSVWEVELAPITRMEAWKVPQIADGNSLAVLGYTFKDEGGKPILRAEFVWFNGKAYALRSSPA